jgi:predicted nucleotidyltransferase
MARTPAPPLLPILRSRHQAEILSYLLSDPGREPSLSDLAHDLGISFATVHREIQRAELAGLVSTRKVRNARLVSANTESPYFTGLADVLLKAFGPPQVVAEEFGDVGGLEEAYVFGSWASRYLNQEGVRPVGDIDVLVLGTPDRDSLYEAAAQASRRLGREVQVTIREVGWLERGTGPFHDTVLARPIVQSLPKIAVLNRGQGARNR